MSTLLRGSQAQSFVESLIHAKTQLQGHHIYLTVGHVARLSGSASFDFGGSEFSDCAKELLQPHKPDPDDYGWWTLEPGTYLIEFNEDLDLPSGHVAVLQPWGQTAANGLAHPTRVLTGRHRTISVPVTVRDVEIHIKENARLSELLVLQLGDGVARSR